jgi:thioesterase domain-containing protein
MERKLAAIWESVLNVRPIGIEDNFFDLGGHSFLVAKLLRRIEVEIGTRLSMAAVFAAPTIARLAELLGDRSLIARVPRTANLQPVGSLEPLFWIYGGPMVRTLAARLGTHRPFLGVRIEHADDEDFSGSTFAQLAARLTHTVRAAQPHGPYYLGGWCVSGLLAYEVASQLIDAGEKVGLVVMLDTVNPAHYRTIPKYRMLASKAIYRLKQTLRTEIGAVFAHTADQWKGFLSQLQERQPEHEDPFQIALGNAAGAYRPKPIRARVLAVQPSERPDARELKVSWARQIEEGEFEVRDVPGDHLSMFEEPHVAALALCLRNRLRDNVVEIRRAAAG